MARGQFTDVEAALEDWDMRGPDVEYLYPTEEFRTRAAAKLWLESVRVRPIVPERRVCLREDKRLPVQQLFREMGWQKILCPKDYFYPEGVRYFYANLVRVGDKKSACDNVLSYVMSTAMSITPHLLARDTLVSSAGMEWQFTNDEEQISKLVSRREVLDCICARPVGNRQPRSVELKPVARVVFNIINTNVLPKAGHREAVSPGYAFVVYCIMKGVKLCLPRLMISFMLYCTFESQTKHICPYPATLTSIMERWKANVSGFQKQSIKTRIDQGTLRRMRIRLPADESLPVEVEASIPSGSRTSVSHGRRDSTRKRGRGALCSGSGNWPRIREDVLVMKEQIRQMEARISIIQKSQAAIRDMVVVLKGLVNDG